MGKGKDKGKGGKPNKGAAGSNKMQPLSNLQLAFNPNLPLIDRPVITLTTAILLNQAADLKLVSDHRRKLPTFGVGLSKNNVFEMVGDLTIAKYLIQTSSKEWKDQTQTFLLNEATSSPVDMARVDQWVEYATVMSRSSSPNKVAAIIATLNTHLQYKTYIVNHYLTLADLAIFAALGWPAEQSSLTALLQLIPAKSPAYRYVQTIASHPAIRESTQLALGVANNYECDFGGASLDPLLSGMNPLEGATPGRVCTRFPPEPSGYLHIGHAKAVLLNDYYARRYQGKLIVRFDDTNPSKEKEEYQTSIMQDLQQRLKIHPKAVYTFTSDYFKVIHGYALQLIQKGLAFMDDTPQAEMQKERMDRKESKHRNQSIEECQRLFDLLCQGKEEAINYCLRIKMDMSSDNGTLRDPVIYRQNVTHPHHRTGTTYKAYPTYDLACPIVDSLEGVSHALRTTEYNDRDEQYARIQHMLNLRRVRIHAFARMNFQYTELSKRKLAWFVDNNHVTGWDDARFPTIRGVIRRGVAVSALRNFICGQGASRRITNMEWTKFWAENKKEIDITAKRFMAVDASQHIILTIENGPDYSSNRFQLTDYLPKNPSFGKRVIRLSNQVLLEKMDVNGILAEEEIVLLRWGVIKVTSIDELDQGKLTGVFVPDGNIRAAKRKISWLAHSTDNSNSTPCTLTEFDNLLSKAKMEPTDNFQDHLNPHTMATTSVLADAGLKTLQKNEIIQLERRGYYRVDQVYISDEKPMTLFQIPDGKAKAMSGLTGKLAHR